MTRKETLRLLHPFCCSSGPWRFHLSKPFSSGGFTFATDGVIIARLPGSHGVKQPEKIRLGGEMADWFSERYKPAPVQPKLVPDLPSAMMGICPGGLAYGDPSPGGDCPGEGCEECGGTGKIEIRQFFRLSDNGFAFPLDCLRLIHGVGGAIYDAPRVAFDDPTAPVAFSFPGGGVGFVNPCLESRLVQYNRTAETLAA